MIQTESAVVLTQGQMCPLGGGIWRPFVVMGRHNQGAGCCRHLGQRPGMLRTFLQGRGQPPHNKQYLAQNVSSAEAGGPSFSIVRMRILRSGIVKYYVQGQQAGGVRAISTQKAGPCCPPVGAGAGMEGLIQSRGGAGGGWWSSGGVPQRTGTGEFGKIPRGLGQSVMIPPLIHVEYRENPLPYFGEALSPPTPKCSPTPKCCTWGLSREVPCSTRQRAAEGARVPSLPFHRALAPCK